MQYLSKYHFTKSLVVKVKVLSAIAAIEPDIAENFGVLVVGRKTSIIVLTIVCSYDGIFGNFKKITVIVAKRASQAVNDLCLLCYHRKGIGENGKSPA